VATVAAATPAAGVVTTVAAAGDASLPDKTSLVLVEVVPFAVAATESAVEVMVTGNRDNWSQAMVEVLVPGVAAPCPVTVSVHV
jgi:hypothetical protein